jgi:hypothetical protein
MDDLVQWLREQIAHDERIARSALERGFVGFIGQSKTAYFEDKGFPVIIARHIDRHRPSDVLAQCEAHERVIRRWEQACDNAHVPSEAQASWGHIARVLAEDVLIIGSAYRHRLGYREEWRP